MSQTRPQQNPTQLSTSNGLQPCGSAGFAAKSDHPPGGGVLPHTREVAGSNPAAPMKDRKRRASRSSLTSRARDRRRHRGSQRIRGRWSEHRRRQPEPLNRLPPAAPRAAGNCPWARALRHALGRDKRGRPLRVRGLGGPQRGDDLQAPNRPLTLGGAAEAEQAGEAGRIPESVDGERTRPRLLEVAATADQRCGRLAVHGAREASSPENANLP